MLYNPADFIQNLKIMNMNLPEQERLISLLIRLVVNLTSATILIMCIYRSRSSNIPFIFSLFLFNLIIFIVGNLFNSLEWTFGSGIGLFAIFTMLRYRSEKLELKEMTYLFLIIAIGFINATGNEISYAEMGLYNLMILGLTGCLEKILICKKLKTRKIKYNNLDLLKPQNKNMLYIDLFEKTGLKPVNTEIDSISFNNNTADLTIYYEAVPVEQEGSTDQSEKIINISKINNHTTRYHHSSIKDSH